MKAALVCCVWCCMLFSGVKIGSLTWNVEVWLEPNLVYWYFVGPFVWSCSQRSYTKVKGHQSSSCKIGSKFKIHLIWNVDVWLEPNLVFWYNLGTFTYSWGKQLQMKVKGHMRSIWKIAWKCKIIHKLLWQATPAVGPRSIFDLFLNVEDLDFKVKKYVGKFPNSVSFTRLSEMVIYWFFWQKSHVKLMRFQPIRKL